MGDNIIIDLLGNTYMKGIQEVNDLLQKAQSERFAKDYLHFIFKDMMHYRKRM